MSLNTENIVTENKNIITIVTHKHRFIIIAVVSGGGNPVRF